MSSAWLGGLAVVVPLLTPLLFGPEEGWKVGDDDDAAAAVEVELEVEGRAAFFLVRDRGLMRLSGLDELDA